MKKRYLGLSTFTILMVALLVLASHAYADDAHRLQMESQLGLDPQADIYYPHATCYYDDLVDHYEQDQIMFDQNIP